ncbi:hypothetical protein CDD83_1569 [Cordyceps sp. RAO-2017]|nr:hypothetical protein CDD83_1569 [Cordyceps sp. RAO-2017]
METLEPFGRYHISFTSAAAAAAYRDALVRLHRLSRVRLLSPTGLWQSCVPPALLSPAGDDPAAELEAFTVAPASRRALTVDRRRVAVGRPWVQRLARLVARHPHKDDRPPAVLLRLYPPTLAAHDLYRYIRESGSARRLHWRVSAPMTLDSDDRAAPDRAEEDDEDDKCKGRFVVVCNTKNEARRFHQFWNQRTLVKEGRQSNVVHTSIISW